MTGIATRLTEWATTSTTTNALGQKSTASKTMQVQVSQYGGPSTLWRLNPPLDGNEYVVICDRGMLLKVTSIEGDPNTGIPTRVPNVVEVFAANADGSIPVMKTLRKPISLNRPLDGINVAQILTALGYAEAPSS